MSAGQKKNLNFWTQNKENVSSERCRCAHANETVPFASAVSVLRPLNVSQHFAVYPLFIYC